MIIFALENLYNNVVARFTLEGTAVPNLFGWREPVKQLTTGSRIQWVPGDDDSGDAGKTQPPRNPGAVPRSIGTLAELVTVYCVGIDTSAPENELAQYKAARTLYDAWFRAVFLAANGTYQILKTKWIVEKTERRHGATLRVLLAIEAKIPDAIPDSAPTDTAAEIGAAELDVTEHQTIRSTDTP